MAEALAAPREELNKYAPRIFTLKVKPDKIRDIIGPGGKTIRGITAQTGVAIDVEDDGTVHIASPDGLLAQKAIDIIKGLTAEAEVGEFYMGQVKRLAEFGASSRSCRAPTVWFTSASSTRSACARSTTSARKATRCSSRSSASTARPARSGCSRREALGKTPDVVHNFRSRHLSQSAEKITGGGVVTHGPDSVNSRGHGRLSGRPSRHSRQTV
jgi:hypothetical protein